MTTCDIMRHHSIILDIQHNIHTHAHTKQQISATLHHKNVRLVDKIYNFLDRPPLFKCWLFLSYFLMQGGGGLTQQWGWDYLSFALYWGCLQICRHFGKVEGSMLNPNKLRIHLLIISNSWVASQDFFLHNVGLEFVRNFVFWVGGFT